MFRPPLLICMLLAVLYVVSCDDDSAPNPCEPNPCEEGSHSLCVVQEGEALCRCPLGTHDTGGECCPLHATYGADGCACDTGYEEEGGRCVAICAAVSGSTQQVAAPTLRATLPASWDENWYASVAVHDLDGDGAKEIVGARHSVLYVWDNHGALLWRAPVGEPATSSEDHGSHRQYASPVVGDLDGDGDGEIAIAYDNKVALYDHLGQLLRGWPQSFPGSDGEIRSLAAADLDGDGALEILAQKTSDGPVTVVWNINGGVREGWPQAVGCDECYDYGGYNQNIGAADLDGDGNPEILSTYDMARIGLFYASGAPFPAHEQFSGPYVSSVPSFHDLDLARQGWGEDGNDRDEFTDSPPTFGDIDGDGELEIVLYSDHERAGEYVILGNCLWVLNPDMTRVAGFETPICSGAPLFTAYEDNIVQVAPSPALGQLSGDPRPEIVVPSYDGKMRCYSPDGAELWSYTFDTEGDPFIGASGAAIGDLNGDGEAEVVFSTYSTQEGVSHLVVLNSTGDVLHQVPIAGRGDMSVPTLADLDGNGRLELLLSLKDVLGGGEGGVQIWELPSAHSNCLYWPTGRGNQLRTGTMHSSQP